MKYISLFVSLLLATLLFSADGAPTFGGSATVGVSVNPFDALLGALGKATLKAGKGIGAGTVAAGVGRGLAAGAGRPRGGGGGRGRGRGGGGRGGSTVVVVTG